MYIWKTFLACAHEVRLAGGLQQLLPAAPRGNVVTLNSINAPRTPLLFSADKVVCTCEHGAWTLKQCRRISFTWIGETLFDFCPEHPFQFLPKSAVGHHKTSKHLFPLSICGPKSKNDRKRAFGATAYGGARGPSAPWHPISLALGEAPPPADGLPT